MSSISDVVSFAFSGTTAKALASLITSVLDGKSSIIPKPPNPTPPTPAATSSSFPIEPPPQPYQQPLPNRRRTSPLSFLSDIDYIPHIDSIIFFVVLTIASTRIAKLHDENAGTARAAAEAFVSGAAAGLCMRLISDIAFKKDKGGPKGEGLVGGLLKELAGRGGKSRGDQRGDEQQRGLPSRLSSRLSWHTLEEDLLLVLDPALTGSLYKILDKLAIKKGAAVANVKRKSVTDFTEVAATTFVVAVLSKALAATATYPLQAAKDYRDQEKEPDAENEGRAIRGIGGVEEQNRSRDVAAAARNNRRRLLSVVLRMAKKEGLQALYTGWLRVIVLGSIGYGLTKAGQEVMEKTVRRILYTLAGRRGGISFLPLRPPNNGGHLPAARGVASDFLQHQQQQQQSRQRLVPGQGLLRPGPQAPALRKLPTQNPPPAPWPRQRAQERPYYRPGPEYSRPRPSRNPRDQQGGYYYGY